jgi:hypothetical protein
VPNRNDISVRRRDGRKELPARSPSVLGDGERAGQDVRGDVTGGEDRVEVEGVDELGVRERCAEHRHLRGAPDDGRFRRAGSEAPAVLDALAALLHVHGCEGAAEGVEQHALRLRGHRRRELLVVRARPGERGQLLDDAHEKRKTPLPAACLSNST